MTYSFYVQVFISWTTIGFIYPPSISRIEERKMTVLTKNYTNTIFSVPFSSLWSSIDTWCLVWNQLHSAVFKQTVFNFAIKRQRSIRKAAIDQICENEKSSNSKADLEPTNTLTDLNPWAKSEPMAIYSLASYANVIISKNVFSNDCCRNSPSVLSEILDLYMFN